MTPLLPQVLNVPGDSGLVKTEQSKKALQIQEVCDVVEKSSPVAELQGHKEFVKVLYECEVLKSPAEVSTTTPVKSQRDIKSELRGQISVTETAERKDSRSLTHKALLETAVIVEEPCRGLKVQTGKDRSLDSTGPTQVRESVETVAGRELIAETTAETKSSAITLAMEAVKHREEVETEQMLLAEELKYHDIECVSSLSLKESTKAKENLAQETFEEKTEDFSPALKIVQNTREAEIEIETSTDSKTGRSRPPEKISVQKHKVTEKPKPDTATNTELKNGSKVQAIQPKNSVTDIEIKHQILVKDEKTKPVLLLSRCEEEESKESRVPPKSRVSKKSRETKEFRKSSEIKEGEEPREATESREPKEARELRQTRKTRELKESRETRQVRKPRETSETKQISEPSKTRELEESKQPIETRERIKTREIAETRELTECIAVPPQRGEIAKTEEVFLKDSVETESTGKRRIPLETTGRGTETTSITIAITISKLPLDC